MRWFPLLSVDPQVFRGICECRQPWLAPFPQPEIEHDVLFAAESMRILGDSDSWRTFIDSNVADAVFFCGAMTNYSEQPDVAGTDADRNHNWYGCAGCIADYEAYWREQWALYRDAIGY